MTSLWVVETQYTDNTWHPEQSFSTRSQARKHQQIMKPYQTRIMKYVRVGGAQ